MITETKHCFVEQCTTAWRPRDSSFYPQMCPQTSDSGPYAIVFLYSFRGRALNGGQYFSYFMQ